MFGKKEPTVLERELKELGEMIQAEEEGSETWHALTEEYIRLDDQNLKHEELKVSRSVSPNTLLNAAKVLLLALLTLGVEHYDVITSKTVGLWLRDRDRD